MDDQQSPPKSVTNLWDVFTITPSNCSSAREVQSAKDLIDKDPAISPEIADHIAGFLDESYLPDPSALSRALISSHAIHGSFEVFIRTFFGGISFMRTGGGGRPSTSRTSSAPSTKSPPSLQSEGGGSTPSGRNSRLTSGSGVAGGRPLNINDDPSTSRTIAPPTLQSEVGGSTSSARNSKFASSLWNRDGRKCEISENFDDKSLVGAHIFPFAIGSGNKKQQFLWELLACFWPPEVVGKIRTECSRINKFSNGISMSSEAHTYFDRLDFYLMPDLSTLSNSKYSATFNWVRRPKGGAIPNYRPECERKIDGHIYRRTMCDGDVVVFETVDPEKYPLPDPGLLWARALLSRVSRPVGGAGDMTLFSHGADDGWSRSQSADLLGDSEKVSRWLLSNENVEIFQEESVEYV